MVCLGLEPGAAGWKAQTNPLSYGGTPKCSYSGYCITNAVWHAVWQADLVNNQSISLDL